MAITSITPTGFSLSVVPAVDRATVVLAGDLDIGTADVLEREMDDLRRIGIGAITIDLRRVGFIDSRGLQLLLVLRNAAKREGRGLTLVPAPDNVQRLFALTATQGLFDWRDAAPRQ
jgi:anti-sigma B factor antagonist